MPKCEHPFDQLTLDAGRTGQRGQASTYKVICSACDTSFAGPLGVQVIVHSGARDYDHLWKAITDLGGKRPVLVQPRARPSRIARCEHYLSWLTIETKSGQRGYSGEASVRCRGCKQAWPWALGLSIFLERLIEDRHDLVDAIRKLGGTV